jgi:hypothetical protein
MKTSLAGFLMGLLGLWSGWAGSAEELQDFPRIGFITQLKGSQVRVSLGREDGAKAGMVVAVVRQGQTVGTVRLTRVRSNRSEGLIETVSAEGHLLYVGDQVEMAPPPEAPSPGPGKTPTAPRPVSPFLGFSLEGYTGLVRTPVAGVLDDGEALGTIAYELPSATAPKPQAGDLDVNTAVGFLPNLELNLRFQAGAAGQSANLQYQLLKETATLPAIAIGSQDIQGTQELRSDYLAISRSKEGTRATVGVGRGQLSGIFGGLETQVGREAVLLADYDTENVNLGLRYRSPRGLCLDLAWLDKKRLVPVVGYRLPLAGLPRKDGPVTLARSPEDDPVPPAEKVAAALIQQGFENVQVGEADSELLIAYENRLFNRNELDGLGVVLAEAVKNSPPRVTGIRAILKEIDIPVLQVRVSVEDYLGFLEGNLDGPTFARKLEITAAPAEPPIPPSSSGKKSFWRWDLLGRPGLTFRVAEDGARFKNSLRGEALTQWGKGGGAYLQVDWPYANSLDADDSPRVWRGMVQQAWRLSPGGVTQLSVGYYQRQRYGLSSETLVPLGNDLAGLRLAQLGPTWSDLSQTSAVAEYRYRLPRWDLTVALSAGQFVDGDRGWGVELGRYFGDVRIAPFLRDTSNGRLGGVRVSLPISRQQDAPFEGPVRLRPGDWFDFRIDSTLEEPNYIRNDIGNILFTGRSADRVFLNNDRLYPAYLRRHVDRLKSAAARYTVSSSKSEGS